jgi:hypothetical protein
MSWGSGAPLCPPSFPSGADRCVRHPFPVGRTAVSAIQTADGRAMINPPAAPRRINPALPAQRGLPGCLSRAAAAPAPVLALVKGSRAGTPRATGSAAFRPHAMLIAG